MYVKCITESTIQIFNKITIIGKDCTQQQYVYSVCILCHSSSAHHGHGYEAVRSNKSGRFAEKIIIVFLIFLIAPSLSLRTCIIKANLN